MEEYNSQFEIYIDFKPSEGDPSRVFQSMANLIDSMNALDAELASMVNINIQPELVLDKIEGGSIKSVLRAIVKDIPDDILEEANFKKILGVFLLKAKYLILKWTDENDQVQNIEQIEDLKGELLILANETDILHFPVYKQMDTEKLLSHINSISNAVEPLIDDDKISYISQEGSTSINSNLDISNEIIVELLTSETIESNGIRILKVKKPDFLGQSKWLLRYQGHQIEAKITDEKWLNSYQGRQQDLQPGDSIKANLNEKISYGHNGEIIHIVYEVTEVNEVIHNPKLIQKDIFNDK